MTTPLTHLTQAAATRRHTMTREQCGAVLRDIGWGVVGVAEPRRTGAVPVGVPAAYAYDGVRLYLAMSPGRKHSALERNPHLCLTVADVRSLDRWRSVVVIGTPRWVTDPSERSSAIVAFAAQHRPQGLRLTTQAAARLSRALVLALEEEELHGCESGESPGDRQAHEAMEDDGAVDRRAVDRPDALHDDVSVIGPPAPLHDSGSPIGCRADEAASNTSTERAADAMNAIRRIVRALRASQDSSEAAVGVSAAQLFVLRQIEKAGAPTIGELARRTVTAQSSVSEVVARLAARGLVLRGRSSTDRRRAEITLTQAGRGALVSAPETIQEHLLAAFERLPAERQRALAEGLVEWNVEAGLEDVAATMFFEPLLEEP